MTGKSVGYRIQDTGYRYLMFDKTYRLTGVQVLQAYRLIGFTGFPDFSAYRLQTYRLTGSQVLQAYILIGCTGLPVFTG